MFVYEPAMTALTPVPGSPPNLAVRPRNPELLPVRAILPLLAHQLQRAIAVETSGNATDNRLPPGENQIHPCVPFQRHCMLRTYNIAHAYLQIILPGAQRVEDSRRSGQMIALSGATPVRRGGGYLIDGVR